MKRSTKILLSVAILMAFITTSLGLTAIAVKSIKLNTANVRISFGKTYKLNVTFTPENATNKKVIFSSANKKIATVSAAGYIKGITPGNTVVTVTSVSNKKAIARCNVTVTRLEKLIKYSWQLGNDMKPDHWLVKKYEEKYNVKITFVPWERGEKEQLKIATGDIPDFMWGGFDTVALYKQGLIRSIPKDYLVKYAPGYWKALEKNPPGVRMNLVPGKEDQYLAIPFINNDGYKVSYIPMYRLDWLEKVGIKPNGKIEQMDTDGKVFFTKEPFTIEQFERILVAFRNDDPDNNGKKDTYGISGSGNPGLGYRYFQSIAGSFGLILGDTEMSNIKGTDGKITNGIITDRYKNFLKLLAKWYKSDLIDPEFPVLNDQSQQDKVTQGIVGTQVNHSYYADASMPANASRPPVSALNNNSKAKFIYAPPEVGPEGYAGTSASTLISNITGTILVVSSKTSNEVLERWLRMFDDVQLNVDNWLEHYYGREGIDYEWSGKPKASAVVRKPTIQSTEPFGNLFLHHYYGYEIFQMPSVIYKMNTYFDGEKYNLRPYKYDLTNSTDFRTLSTKYKAALATIRDEFFLKAVTGKIDIDAEWDKYVNQWLNAGGRELLQELEKAPTVQSLRSKY